MVNIGRGVLVNYNWASDVKAGRDPGEMPVLQNVYVAVGSGPVCREAAF